ncbi:MAG: type III pantothenate kinase [Spirochaetales bacterium]|nr:type III pantothenate kinase [Spirochaetales bacterium]
MADKDIILAIDIGNTNITMSTHDGTDWGDVVRVKTKSKTCVQEATSKINTMVFNKAVISSVVPNLTGSIIEAVRVVGGFTPVVIANDIESGLDKASIPPELGADILCNLIAAHSMYPSEYVLVADFGTAFTTETVSPEGKVLGVTIGPGMMTSVKALFENAAQLPQIRLDIPTTALGRDTVSSIRAGVVYGFMGQLVGIVNQVEKEIGHKLVVIATGGFSKYLEGYIYVNKADVKHTLEGARIACLLNS